MKLKKEIGEILKYLKNEGHGRREIEKRLAYTEKYIDQAYSRGGSEELLTRLKFYKEYVILRKAINANRGTIVNQIDGDDSLILEEIRINFDRLSSAIGQLTGIGREEILPSSRPYPLDKIAAFYNLRQGDKKKHNGK